MTDAPKIIFLDIDGPMIPHRALLLPGQTPIMTIFDPVAVSLVNHLCEEYGWKLVIHSAWIRIYGGAFTHNHCIEQGLKAEHFHEDAWCSEHIDWRYTRIAEWLKRHPEVTVYAAVDDEPYGLDQYDKSIPHPPGLASNVVLVNYFNGFLYGTFFDIQQKAKDETQYKAVGVFDEAAG